MPDMAMRMVGNETEIDSSVMAISSDEIAPVERLSGQHYCDLDQVFKVGESPLLRNAFTCDSPASLNAAPLMVNVGRMQVSASLSDGGHVVGSNNKCDELEGLVP